MANIEISPKQKKWATVIAFIVGIPLMALVSGTIILALKGLLGLAAVIPVLGAMYVMLKLVPWFSLKASNIGMRMFVKEVEENPIESMLSLRIEQEKEIDESDLNNAEWEGEIENFRDKVKDIEKKYPEEVESYAKILAEMEMGLTDAKSAQEEARRDLEDLIAKIDKAQTLFDMALAVEKVTAFSKSAEARVFRDIKEKVAFDAVRKKLNASRAHLALARARRQTRGALPPAQQRPKLIDVTPVQGEKAKVLR